MFVSYAQNFEDVMLWRALRSVDHGVYIDVGAQDPVVDSISLAFFERGWRGVHVEPEPRYAAMLRQDRPGDLVIEAAIGSADGLVKFYAIPDTGISTVDPEIADAHRARGWTIRETMTPCVPLATVFSACEGPEIHWLKIDVEGSEASVIASWGEDPRLPWIVVVESTLPLSQIESHAAWEPMLLRRGYEAAYFDGLNRFYVSPHRPELKADLSVPPNVFDKIAINGTASTTLHHLLASRHRAELEGARAESISALERAAVALGNARSEREGEFRNLAQALEKAQQGLDLQQRLAIEQTESFSRASAALAVAVAGHEAALGLLRDRHQQEIDSRLERERDLERAVQRAESAVQEHDVLAQSLHGRLTELRQAHDVSVSRIHGLEGEREALQGEQLSLAQGYELVARSLVAVEERFARSRRHAEALGAELARLKGSWYGRLFYRGAASGPENADGGQEDEVAEGLVARTVPASSPVLSLEQHNPQVPVTEVSSMSASAPSISSVNDLLFLHDVSFVEAAYRALLRRDADPGGRADYLEQLRSGTAKEEILLRLARSDEGVRASATLEGLEKFVAERVAARPSLLQRLIRRAFKGANADVERSTRRLENLVVRLANANADRLDRLELRLLHFTDQPIARGLDGSLEANRGDSLNTSQRHGGLPGEQDVSLLGLQTLTEQERFVLRKISKL